MTERAYIGPHSVHLMVEGAHPKDGRQGEARARRIWGRGGYVRCYELDHGWVVHSREMHRCHCPAISRDQATIDIARPDLAFFRGD